MAASVIQAFQHTVTTTPYKIMDSISPPDDGSTPRQSITIRNYSGSTVFLDGTSAVVPATGFPLLARETFTLDQDTWGSLWAVCDTGGSTDLRWLIESGEGR